LTANIGLGWKRLVSSLLGIIINYTHKKFYVISSVRFKYDCGHYRKSVSPCSTLRVICLTANIRLGWGRLVFSLLGIIINYRRKKFYIIGSWRFKNDCSHYRKLVSPCSTLRVGSLTAKLGLGWGRLVLSFDE
jgi:hypothetical protein